MPTTLWLICSETMSKVLSMATLTRTGSDIGAIGSPFSAFARTSANLTGPAANSASKNVSSPVNCGVTMLSTRRRDVTSAAGSVAPRPPPPARPAVAAALSAAICAGVRPADVSTSVCAGVSARRAAASAQRRLNGLVGLDQRRLRAEQRLFGRRERRRCRR